MLKRLVLAMLLVVTPLITNAQKGFLLGLGNEMLIGSSGDKHGGGSAAVLYTANEEILRTVDPLTMRQVAIPTCFYEEFGPASRRAEHKTLDEIFAELTKKRAQRKRTVLQIIRVFDPQSTPCAAIWFTYVEQ